MTHFLFTGTNIQASATDELQCISEIQLVKLIQQSNTHIMDTQQAIRNLLSVEKNALAQLKKTLPYFIGASFGMNIRKSQNFTEIFYLILDIDKIENNLATVIKQRIITDTRIVMCFTSPGGNGLKCLFKLSNPIRNTAVYSQFYKTFAYNFAAQYNISEYIDYSTCDVTRVCFMAHDSDVYYNQNATMLNVNNSGENITDGIETISDDTTTNKPLTANIYSQILLTLDPKNYAIKKPKNVYVPAELQMVHHLVEEMLTQNGMIIKENRDINYGKKIVIQHDNNIAEINIYHGKNGFQIVRANKAGMHAALTDVCVAIVMKALHQFVHT